VIQLELLDEIRASLDVKRTPNNYDSAYVEPTETLPSIIENEEFTNFIVGQSSGVSEDTHACIKQITQHADDKMNLFFTAYAQKNMSRMARVMTFLDKADNELFNNEWRLKALDNATLVDLIDNLTRDKARSLKELMDISLKFGSSAQSYKKIEQSDNTRVAAEDLPEESRNKLLSFYKQKVAC